MLRLKIIFLLLFAFSCAVFSQEYWYGSIDMNNKSRSYPLNFGMDMYSVPTEIRGTAAYPSKGNKMEIINELQKKGWELIKLDENTLYFRYDMEQVVKKQRYWYGSIDLSKESRSYPLDFGMDMYSVPTEIRGTAAYPSKGNKMEIINELQKKGWEYPAELQYGDSLLIFRFVLQEKDGVKKQRYWYGTIDLSKESRSYPLDFGMDMYSVPTEIRGTAAYPSKGNKMEIINELQKKGWELIKLDPSTLYFRYDTEQVVKKQKYWYGSIDLSKESRSYPLNFGMDMYSVPTEIRGTAAYPSKGNKMEIINELQKKGWELIMLDENTLYFRYDMEQVVKKQRYWYGSIDLSKESRSYPLDFGMDMYSVPTEIRGTAAYPSKGNKMEIINNLQKKGWEYPAELQYGDSLLIFRMKLNK